MAIVREKDYEGHIQHRLARRLAVLEHVISEGAANGTFDVLAGTYLDQVLLPRIQEAADMVGYQEGGDNFIPVADAVLQAIGASNIESVYREGQGPKLVIDQEQMNRMHRVAQHSEHFPGLSIAAFGLPLTPGYADISLKFEEGLASLATNLGPSKIDNFGVVQLAGSLDLGGGSSSEQVQRVFFEAVGKQLNPDAGDQAINLGRGEYYRKDSVMLKKINRAFNAAICERQLGGIPMSNYPGYKETEAIQVATALDNFARTAPMTLPDGYTVDAHTARHDIGVISYTIKGGEDEYVLGLSRSLAGEDDNLSSAISLLKTRGQVSTNAPQEEFVEALNRDLQVTQAALDWVYRYAEVDAREIEVGLEVSNDLIGAAILKTGLVEKLSPRNVGHRFDQIGGQSETKAEAKVLADAVIRHMKGEGPQPGHAIIIGKSGSGKTTMAGGILNELMQAGIPAYRVKSSALAGETFAADPSALLRLFLLATVDNAVIYFPDLDTSVGTSAETRDSVQGQLNRLLETTARLNRVWVMADSANPGSLRDSLIEPHRLGSHVLQIDLEKDPEAVKDLLTKIITNQISTFGEGNIKANEVLESPELDLKVLAEKIVEAGNIVPARLAAIVENLLLTRRKINTDNCLGEIDKANKWQKELERERAKLLETGWIAAIDAVRGEVERLARAVEQRQTSNEEALTELRDTVKRIGYTMVTANSFDGELTRLEVNVNDLYDEINLRLRALEQKLGINLPVGDDGEKQV